MSYEEMLYATKGPVGYLTLNNPEKVNALVKKYDRRDNSGA